MPECQKCVIVLGVSIMWCFMVSANSKDVFSGGSNGTRAYTIFINRFVCVDMPYEKTEVLECRTVLRRNKLPLLRIVVNTPYVIDYVMIHIQLNYKFNTFQPFLINDMVEGCQYLRTPKYDPLSIYLLNIGKQMVPEVVQPCPQGNRIYNQTVEFKESYAPKSVPAGAYRFDIRLSDRLNVTMLAVQVFGGVRRQGILGSMLEWLEALRFVSHKFYIKIHKSYTVLKRAIRTPEKLNYKCWLKDLERNSQVVQEIDKQCAKMGQT